MSYLKVFDSGLLSSLKGQFTLASISSVHTSAMTKQDRPKSKSSPVDKQKPVPAFDTSLGSSAGSSVSVKYPSSDASIYIFQTLSLNGYHCLTFYDTGASGHLVRGPTAEAAGFKTIDPRTQLIGGVGNMSFFTEYGVYSARLGPDPEGSYHEMIFQGIDQITPVHPNYDLSEINTEVSSSGKLPKDTTLPKHAGGVTVDLIIGISNPELVPKLLFWLPSGIGVFESALKDINSSRIMYGGTHSSITRMN